MHPFYHTSPGNPPGFFFIYIYNVSVPPSALFMSNFNTKFGVKIAGTEKCSYICKCNTRIIHTK